MKKKLNFVKLAGRWFVHLPNYPGHYSELEMVLGADVLCDMIDTFVGAQLKEQSIDVAIITFGNEIKLHTPYTPVKELQDKGLVVFNDNKVILSESEKEVNTVNSKKDLQELELNQKEIDSYNLIKDLVDERNLISKYTLEGHLLYGDLELSNFRMYHIILSLQNKGLLKTIDKDDGEYYLLVE